MSLLNWNVSDCWTGWTGICQTIGLECWTWTGICQTVGLEYVRLFNTLNLVRQFPCKNNFPEPSYRVL
jgi:hypothetical protein